MMRPSNDVCQARLRELSRLSTRVLLREYRVAKYRARVLTLRRDDDDDAECSCFTREALSKYREPNISINIRVCCYCKDGVWLFGFVVVVVLAAAIVSSINECAVSAKRHVCAARIDATTGFIIESTTTTNHTWNVFLKKQQHTTQNHKSRDWWAR